MAVWSIVDFADLGEDFILAAEHYHPAKISALQHLAQLSGKMIGELFEEVQDTVKPGMAEQPARLYDLTDALGNLLRPGTDLADANFLSNRKRVQAGDVIISRLRSYLREVVVIPALPHEVLVSPEFIVLRLRTDNDLESSAWLLPFLLSATVQTILHWSQTGSAHPRFNSDTLLAIRIPDQVVRIANELSEAVQSAHSTVSSAAGLYNEAEALLLHELGLDRVTLPTAKTYTAPFAEVMAAGRMDAEFFRPQHRFILEHLRSKFSGRTLGELGTVTKGKTPAEYVETGVPVVRSGDLSDIDATESFLRANPADVRFELQSGDVLISSIGFGSIGKVQVFNSPDRHTTVNEVTVVRQHMLNPYYLRTFLASPLGQIQIESWVTGATGQLHLNSKDVMKIVVPVISPAVQAQFETLYVEAQRLKLEAVELLATAQRRVEEFIRLG